MSYFHTGTRTIIGAESFHCPVRDGKEWDQLAMVIRLKLSLACTLCGGRANQSIRGVDLISILIALQRITRQVSTGIHRYNDSQFLERTRLGQLFGRQADSSKL